jgi:hypothetical protein
MLRSPTVLVLATWLLLGAIVVGIERPPPGEPGLNYDEAFLGQQARDFLEPDRLTQHPPSERSTWIAGRRFPLRNASYLGALKSQLLIPSFALFGADLETMRSATLGTALLALLFATLWARRVFGLPVALLGAVLVAFDPSFVFFGTCEWGPYTTLLLCRCAGLYALTVGWQSRRTGLLVAGALAMGLGVYARADFVLIGVAAALALLLVRGPTLLAEIRSRPGAVALALGAVVLGASPMILSLIDLLTVEVGIADRGDLAYRAQVMWSSLDGSYYYRVIAQGGVFERIFDEPAPGSLFGFAVLAAVAAALPLALRLPRAGEEDGREGLPWLALTVALLGGFMVALPGAVRAHHMLNVMPFTHLLLAAVLVALAKLQPRRVLAAVASLLALVVLASATYVTFETRELIAQTGGRGRYSNALDEFAAELRADPHAAAISLDWGFHETFQFLTTTTRLAEPIWSIPRQLSAGRPWLHAGDEHHHYLVFAPRYDLFQLGPKLLAAARALPAEQVAIREHRDREGEIAFYSVRFLGPHQLAYTGEFAVRFGSTRVR